MVGLEVLQDPHIHSMGRPRLSLTWLVSDLRKRPGRVIGGVDKAVGKPLITDRGIYGLRLDAVMEILLNTTRCWLENEWEYYCNTFREILQSRLLCNGGRETQRLLAEYKGPE